MRTICVSLWLVALVSSLAVAAELPNLVRNPGFEERDERGAPQHWTADPKVYQVVSDPVRSGQGALQFINEDPNRYVMARQAVPLEPGKSYEVRAWVRPKEITGTDSGATVCLEWYTAEDKWLGGFYPSGVKGTTDWSQVGGFSGKVPPAAAKAYVLCYVRKGMTGQAWWDEVEVRQWQEPPLQSLLLEPGYRGLLTPDTRTARLHVALKLEDYQLQPAQVSLQVQLTRRGETQALQTWTEQPKTAEVELTLPLPRLEIGRYDLRLVLTRRDTGTLLGEDRWRLEQPQKPLDQRTSYIDAHQRLIVGGEPFFPLGMYWTAINEDELKVYADSGFNCLMPYGMPSPAQMDLAHRYGMKVIYTLKDTYFGSKYCPPAIKRREDERPFVEGKVQAFREHPALLAWYLNDELSPEYMDRLEAHQEWLEELDPDHPTWIVLYQVNMLDRYRKTYDVLGTDPYPISQHPARLAADWTKLSLASVRHSRPVWMVPQVMNWGVYRREEAEKYRAPTREEMRSMAWQCIAEGARGLIFYSFYDLKKEPDTRERRWAEVQEFSREIRELIPVLLSVEKTPALTTPPQDWLHWTTRQVGPTTYLIVVNDEGEAHRAEFTLPGRPREVKLRGSQAAIAPAAKLTVDLAPFAVQVYEMNF
jgi:hypothetical protein